MPGRGDLRSPLIQQNSKILCITHYSLIIQFHRSYKYYRIRIAIWKLIRISDIGNPPINPPAFLLSFLYFITPNFVTKLSFRKFHLLNIRLIAIPQLFVYHLSLFTAPNSFIFGIAKSYRETITTYPQRHSM